MTKTIDAIFDGEVLHLVEPVDLKPNTRVRITIESSNMHSKKAHSFLRTAKSLNLEGPSDWSLRFEDYLYKNETTDVHFRQAGFQVLLK